MTRRPFWWRRRAWQPAKRCGWCGWYQPDSLNGRVYGKHDPAFTGHAPLCPERMFPAITTAEELADQWAVLTEWAQASQHLGDWIDWQQTWHDWSAALLDRSLQLELALPPVTAEQPGPGD